MDELEYLEIRARQEAAAAEASNVPEAASAHRRLAAEYEARARELSSNTSVACVSGN